MSIENHWEDGIDELCEQWRREDEALMDNFNQKLTIIALKWHNELLDIWKKWEESLLASLDSALKNFEDNVNWKMSISKQEAKKLIQDGFEEFWVSALLSKYQINSQAVFDLDNMQYDTIRNFRVYIEEQKIKIKAKFTKIYATMEAGKQDLLEN